MLLRKKETGEIFDCFIWGGVGTYRGHQIEGLATKANIKSIRRLKKYSNISTSRETCHNCGKLLAGHGFITYPTGVIKLVCPESFILKSVNGALHTRSRQEVIDNYEFTNYKLSNIYLN